MREVFWHLATLSIEGLTFKTADRHGRNTDVGFSCHKTLSKFWIFFFPFRVCIFCFCLFPSGLTLPGIFKIILFYFIYKGILQ